MLRESTDKCSSHPAPTFFEGVTTTLTLRERLIGLWHWPGYRLFGRCWAQGCGRLMIFHSPWALYICERTPMGIVITPQGEAYYQEMVIEQTEKDFAA